MTDTGYIEVAASAIERATLSLQQTFGADFNEGLSVGLLGSFARGDAGPTSDIDYYVVFDTDSFEQSRRTLSVSDMSDAVGRAMEAAATDDRNPIAGRFSAYWTTILALETGSQLPGRWPVYDRMAWVHERKHLAGKTVDAGRVPAPSREQMLNESAQFLLSVVRPKLDQAGLLAPKITQNVADLERIGQVVLSKAVLMPVRLMYALSPLPGRPIVSCEFATATCADRYGHLPFFRLVEAAMLWRAAPPSRVVWSQALPLLREHLRPLYATCLAEHLALLPSGNGGGLRQLLGDWYEMARSP